MAVRNRRSAGSSSDDVENMSEHAEKAARRAVEETAHQTSTAALAAFDAFNAPFAKVMDQNRLIFQKMLHAMQEESLRFVNRRLEHTSHAIESSRDCQGLSGLMAVQQEFLMDLARDYADQTRRFADLVRELAEDGTSGFTEAANAMSEPIRHAVHRAEMRSDVEHHRTAAE